MKYVNKHACAASSTYIYRHIYICTFTYTYNIYRYIHARACTSERECQTARKRARARVRARELVINMMQLIGFFQGRRTGASPCILIQIYSYICKFIYIIHVLVPTIILPHTCCFISTGQLLGFSRSWALEECHVYSSM